MTAAAEAEQTRLTREGQGRAAAVSAAAEAEQTRLAAEGQGHADATKASGLAEAAAISAKGQAEAQAIKAKGQAEAEVKELLAQAYAKYGQQAVIDRVLTSMPEMLAAVAKPIGDVDNITVIGDAGAATGVTKISTDLLVKLPAVVKAATGLDLTELMKSWFAEGTTPASPEPVSITPAPTSSAE